MEKEKTDEGTQTTPDLDQAMREGRIPFDGGDPANAAAPLLPGTPGPDDGEKKGEEAAAAGKEKTGEEEDGKGAKKVEDPGAKVEEKKEIPAVVKKPPEDEKPEEIAARIKKEDTPPETAFRFKNHPEAEKGYRELQGRTTRAEKRAKDAEDELNRVKNAERIQEEQAAAKATLVNYVAERRAQALEEIDALDPEDPAYRKNAATCLAKADTDIFDRYREQEDQRPGAAAAEAAATKTGKETAAPVDQQQHQEVYRYAQEKITEEGLDPDDPLFWIYAGQAPIADEKGGRADLDTQIAWAVSQTKLYHDKIQAKTKAAGDEETRERVRKKQEQELPLGRTSPGGGAKPGGKAADADADKPVSLADAVESALEQRRL